MTQETQKPSSARARLYPITIPFKTVRNTTVFISSLSKLSLLQLDSQFSTLPTTLKINTILASLQNKEDLDCLLFSEVNTIYDKIIEMSTFSVDNLNSISMGLLVISDKKYSTPDFRSCTICKERGLDKRRNCPMLDDSTHNTKSVIYTFENDPNKLVRVCPMYDVNNSVDLSYALGLLTMLELNTFPVSGGLLEQTIFVNEVIPLIKPLLDKKRIPMM